MGRNEIVATSGPYSFGHALAYRELRGTSLANYRSQDPVRLFLAGDYTLIVSAFEPRHLGAFKLRIESSLRFDLTPIPQEGAGMFNKVIRDAW